MACFVKRDTWVKEWGLIALKLKLLRDEMGKLILGSTLGLVAVLVVAPGFVSTCACMTCLPVWAVGEQQAGHSCREQEWEKCDSAHYHKEERVFLHKTKMCAKLPPHTLSGHLGLVEAERMSWCCVTCSNMIQTGISTLSQQSVVFSNSGCSRGWGSYTEGKIITSSSWCSAMEGCCPPSTGYWWDGHLM